MSSGYVRFESPSWSEAILLTGLSWQDVEKNHPTAFTKLSTELGSLFKSTYALLKVSACILYDYETNGTTSLSTAVCGHSGGSSAMY